MMTHRTASCYLFVFLCSLYFLTAGGHYGGDGFWNYLTARSLVLNGSLDISGQRFSIPEMQRQYDAVAGSGRMYSKYGLGVPLFEIPFFVVGHLLSQVLSKLPADYLTFFSTSLTNVFVCALWGVGFFYLSLLLSYQRRAVWWLTIIFSLGSMAFPYAGYGFSEPLVGLSLLGTTWGCFYYVRSVSFWALTVAGACLGIAVLTKVYAIITLPFFVFYIWPTYSEQKRISALAFLAPLALFFGTVLWHNYARYGDIFLTGYHLDTLAQQGGYFVFWPTQILTALYGLLLSTGRGLVFFLPVVCLVPFAYCAFKQSHPREANLFVGLVAIHFVLIVPMIDWHAGSSWGPRYLLPIVPYLILPLGRLIENSAAKRVLVFGIAGLFAKLPGVLANPHLFVRFVQEKKIGDLIFYPGHPGDLLFSPYVSPILGGYYQIVSGLKQLMIGTSLTYTISSGTTRSVSASLEGYDILDLWWLNAIQTGLLSPMMVLILLFFVVLLIVIAIYTVRQLVFWQHQAEGNRL